MNLFLFFSSVDVSSIRKPNCSLDFHREMFQSRCHAGLKIMIAIVKHFRCLLGAD